MIFPIGQLNATIGQLMIPSNRDIFEEANDFRVHLFANLERMKHSIY
jgi:hypothetical protein